MKTILKSGAMIFAAWVAFMLTMDVGFHGGLVGWRLAQAQQAPIRKMGPTFQLKPGQTFTLTNPDGTQFNTTILSGTITAPPAGFVHFTPPGKDTFFECASAYHLVDGGCADGTVIHYWNPATGEKMDQLLTRVKKSDGSTSFKISPLPTPQSRLELKWGSTAYASIGDSFDIGNLNITVIDITYNPGGTYSATLDVNGQLVITEGEIT